MRKTKLNKICSACLGVAGGCAFHAAKKAKAAMLRKLREPILAANKLSRAADRLEREAHRVLWESSFAWLASTTAEDAAEKDRLERLAADVGARVAELDSTAEAVRTLADASEEAARRRRIEIAQFLEHI
jgi:hypothetical protein